MTIGEIIEFGAFVEKSKEIEYKEIEKNTNG